MTRRFHKPRSIRVVAGQDGLPSAFRWNQMHEITDITNHWRLNTLWWRDQVWRDYFKVVTTSGMLAILYHDRLTGDWYLQQLYD
jgi:hypothetical protein